MPKKKPNPVTQAVTKALRQANRPVSFAELHDAAKAAKPKATRADVDRVLKSLVEAGKAKDLYNNYYEHIPLIKPIAKDEGLAHVPSTDSRGVTRC